jgi:hypothetical protein
MLTERDTLNKDGSLNWRAIREIATLRAMAELDAEIVSRVYGPVLRLPAGVSQDNVREWKNGLARKALIANPSLETTPYVELYRRELRRARDAAKAIRNGLKFRHELVSAEVVPLPKLRLVDQLIKSVKQTLERVS